MLWLQSACLTQVDWFCRYMSIKGVLITLNPILSTLEKVAEGSHARRSIDSRGIVSQLPSFQFILLLLIFVKVLSVTHAVSEQLQSPPA